MLTVKQFYIVQELMILESPLVPSLARVKYRHQTALHGLLEKPSSLAAGADTQHLLASVS